MIEKTCDICNTLIKAKDYADSLDWTDSCVIDYERHMLILKFKEFGTGLNKEIPFICKNYFYGYMEATEAIYQSIKLSRLNS